jgi:branched-chain amino acid transport system permease protein
MPAATEILQQVVNGTVIGSVYVLIALGLTVIFGILGVAHFAHGSVAMFGGYLTYWLSQNLGLSLYPAMLLAIPVGAALGAVLELVAYRPVRNAAPINAFIVALGLTMLVDRLNMVIFGPDQLVIRTPYNGVYQIGSVVVTELRLQVIAITIALLFLIGYLIARTSTGRAVRAVAQNPYAATLMGIDVNRISLLVFAVSSGLGVVAGALVGALLALAPGVGENLVVKGFAILILGGLGSIPGAIIGGLALGITESLAAGLLSSAYKDVIAFMIMIIVILVRPQGLMGRS